MNALINLISVHQPQEIFSVRNNTKELISDGELYSNLNSVATSLKKNQELNRDRLRNVLRKRILRIILKYHRLKTYGL